MDEREVVGGGRDYAPDGISVDYIEHVCDDLRWKLIDVLNGGGEDEYDRASELLGHICAMLDDMVSD